MPPLKTGQRFTHKEERFIAEYLIDGNATQAAIRAGYSAKNAGKQAKQLLTRPRLVAAIHAGQKRMAKKSEITAERVLAEYARIAFFNPQRIFTVDADGLPQIDMSEATEDDWRVVSEVANTFTQMGSGEDSIKLNRAAKIKLHCKLQALNQLGKHLGLFADAQGWDLSKLTEEELARLDDLRRTATNL